MLEPTSNEDDFKIRPHGIRILFVSAGLIMERVEKEKQVKEKKREEKKRKERRREERKGEKSPSI